MDENKVFSFAEARSITKASRQTRASRGKKEKELQSISDGRRLRSTGRGGLTSFRSNDEIVARMRALADANDEPFANIMERAMLLLLASEEKS